MLKFMLALALLPGFEMLHAQGYPPNYPPAGGYYQRQPASPAERTIEDLRRISERETFSHGEHDRYQHAIEHLAEFSGKLYGGRFDRGKLDRGKAGRKDKGADERNNVASRSPTPPRRPTQARRVASPP